MDLSVFLKAIALGIVEGVTEFIPVSSTGHLILAQNWLNFTGSKENAFVIFIQLGAIFAVVWLYRKKFLSISRNWREDQTARQLIYNLIIGSIPAVIIGLPAEKWIEINFFKPIPVSIALIAGGVAIILIERRYNQPRIVAVDVISFQKAFGIGLFQVLAVLFPGVSRSAATILGGMMLGLSRMAAMEFSFFLAIPAMFGASLVKLFDNIQILSLSDIPVFFTGFMVSFIVALIVIKALLKFVSSHSFVPFAWYRIIFGAVIGLMYWNAAGGFEW